MMTYNPTSLEVIIDGVAHDVAGNFEYVANEPAAEGLLPSLDYYATGEITLDADGWSRFCDALRANRNRGASDETLARRTLYGGRKGRRARRRLAAKGLPIVLEFMGLSDGVHARSASALADLEIVGAP